MEQGRFDRLARRLSDRGTRRGVVAGALGGLLAVVGAGSAVEEAAALTCLRPGRGGCKGPKNRKCCAGSVCRGGSKTQVGRCVCPGRTQRPCGGRCVRIDASPNCGGCGRRCDEFEICGAVGAGYACIDDEEAGEVVEE